MAIEGVAPPSSIPLLWCDFNAHGLSGEPGDECYYSLHRDELEKLNPTNGMLVFIYDDDLSRDKKPEIMGYIATLEQVTFRNALHWRACPDKTTCYRGPAPWRWAANL
jgi:hypothetical protein